MTNKNKPMKIIVKCGDDLFLNGESLESVIKTLQSIVNDFPEVEDKSFQMDFDPLFTGNSAYIEGHRLENSEEYKRRMKYMKEDHNARKRKYEELKKEFVDE